MRSDRLPGVLIGGFWLAGFSLAATADPGESSPGTTRELVDIQFSGSLRARYEHLDRVGPRGYGAPDADLLLGRIRLRAVATTDAGPVGTLELQSAGYRLSGSRTAETGGTPYRDDLGVRLAYIEWADIADSGMGLSLGRQDIEYGAGRLFAPVNWSNVGGYWWDAAKLYRDDGALRLDALYARRVIVEPGSPNVRHQPYHLAALIGRLQEREVVPELFYLLKRSDSAPREDRHTWGLSIHRPPGNGWDGLAWAALQRGEVGGDAIAAHALLVRAGYTFDAPGRPRTAVEWNRASGDRRPDDRRDGTFDGLFGSTAQPYGWMNVVTLKNLDDLAATLQFRPVNSILLTAEYHYFHLAEPRDAWYGYDRKPARRDPTGAAGTELGHEVDFIVGWTPPLRHLAVLAGAARFWPGAFVRRTEGGSKPANWLFAQIEWRW